MSTRLPLGWARILDCLPSLDYSSPALVAALASSKTENSGSLNTSVGESSNIFRLDGAVPGVVSNPNLISAAPAIEMPSIS